MITFENHMWLAALIVPLAYCFHVWLSRGHKVTLPMDGSQVRTNRWLSLMVNGSGMLPALILAVIICVLAGPKIQGEPEEERIMTNILFALDSSGSMNASMGGGKRRTQVAMESIVQFTQYRKGDAFGLTVFGNEFWHWVPITTDTSAIENAMPFVEPRKLPRWFGGTNIANAMLGCRDVLIEKDEGDRMIILVSDGHGGPTVKAATELREAGIVCYCIQIGGTNIPAEIQALAGITGGKVFAAKDPAGVAEVFRHIDGMAKAKFKKSEPRTEEFYLPFSLLGLALCGFYLFTLLGLRYTPW